VARDPETLDISDRVGVERDGAIRCKSKRPRRHAGASTRNNNETKRWPTPRRSGGRVSLGRLAECDDMLTGVEWRHGFIRSARVSYTHERFNNERPQVSIEQALGTLLDDPGPGRLIERLIIGLALHDDNDYSGVCEAIGAHLRPCLTELEIGDFGYEECELNWSTIGDASTLLPAVPNLRSLWLRAGAMQL